jgi:hypothetical protein
MRRPDIYLLILDSYARADVLREVYGFDNPLPHALTALGYTVPRQSAGNYSQTLLSLASSLNLEYLPELLQRQPRAANPRLRFAEFIERNRTFRTLAAAGYRIRAYGSEYAWVRPADVDERPQPWLYFREIEFGLFTRSMGPLLSLLMGQPQGAASAALHRHHVNWTFDHLRSHLPASQDPPTLVFAHLLIPHPPFVFAADGSPLDTRLPVTLDDDDEWREAVRKSGGAETYNAGYVQGVQYLNSRLVELAQAIHARKGTRESLVIIQADHGPRSRPITDGISQSAFRERLGILLAAHIPDPSVRSEVYESITPVNMMRLALRQAVGVDLPLLPDRSFYSPWASPTDFDEVTPAVR